MKKDGKVKKISFAWLPGAVLVAAFFALRGSKSFMDAAERIFCQPVRGILSRLTDALSFSLMEILLAVGVIWLFGFIIRTLILLLRRKTRGVKIKFFLRRLSVLITVAVYIWAAFLWLWSVSCFSSTFCEKSGFERRDVSVEELYGVTVMFAENANRLSGQVQRDEKGLFAQEDFLPKARACTAHCSRNFPSLTDFTARPRLPVRPT